MGPQLGKNSHMFPVFLADIPNKGCVDGADGRDICFLYMAFSVLICLQIKETRTGLGSLQE